jgi:hypothetical protein
MAGKEPWTAAEVWLDPQVSAAEGFSLLHKQIAVLFTQGSDTMSESFDMLAGDTGVSGLDKAALCAFCVDTLTGREVHCPPMERRFALYDASVGFTAYCRYR